MESNKVARTEVTVMIVMGYQEMYKLNTAGRPLNVKVKCEVGPG